MNTILSKTIWGRKSIPYEEWHYRNLKRIMFPFINVMYFFAGIVSLNHGVWPLNQHFPSEILNTFSILLSVSAVICFIGISIPKLWIVEIIGKSMIIGLMAGYIVSIALVNEAQYFDLFVSIVAITPIVWRVSLLGGEWQTRRLNKQRLGE